MSLKFTTLIQKLEKLSDETVTDTDTNTDHCDFQYATHEQFEAKNPDNILHESRGDSNHYINKINPKFKNNH